MRKTSSFAHASEVIFAVEKCCCSFYGSNLYDLRSESIKRLVAAWRTNVKLSWDVDRSCHNYFLSSVLAPGYRPLLASLLSRFHNFFRSLLVSPSREVQVMARLSSRDIRSNIGSNLSLIIEKTGLDPWEASNVIIKQSLTAAETILPPEGEEWRVRYLPKLLSARLEAFYEGNQEEETRLTDLINSLVTN